MKRGGQKVYEDGIPGTVKQRIIGAVVLVATAAILLPLVLDFGGEYRVDTGSQIPPRPQIDPVSIARPDYRSEPGDDTAPGSLFRLDASRDAAEAALAAGKVEQMEPSGLTEDGVPRAWVLQVASFADLAKSRELSSRLLADGHRTYVRSATKDGNAVHRVYVGPFIGKQDALDTRRAVEKKYRVETLVLRFEP